MVGPSHSLLHCIGPHSDCTAMLKAEQLHVVIVAVVGIALHCTQPDCTELLFAELNSCMMQPLSLNSFQMLHFPTR